MKMEDIAALIRQAEEIQVVDNATGADITVGVLEQIIFLQESRRWRGIPEYAMALQDSIRMGGGIMTNFLRKTVLSGLGALLVTKEGVEKLLEELTRRGEISGEEAPRLLEEMMSRVEQNSRKIESEIRQRVEKTVRSLFPEISMLDNLNARVEALAAEVEALRKAVSAPQAGPKRRAAPRKKPVSGGTGKTRERKKKSPD